VLGGLATRFSRRRSAAALAVIVASIAVAPIPAGPSVAAAAQSSFAKTVTIARTYTISDPSECHTPGHVTANVCEIESRKVTVHVDRTQGLQDQQQIAVTWTGAHPTNNYPGDPNSSTSDLSEYPMVLLQCRGTTATVTPETCWAPLDQERVVTTGENSGAADVGTFPAWRLDRYAEPAERKQFTGIPPNPPDGCPTFGQLAEHVQPFRAADGTRYYGSGQNTLCGNSPPEAGSFSNSGSVSDLPDNATFALTNANGSGAHKFSVRDISTNASIGCSATVACVLVAIPVIGISCDPNFDTDDPGPGTYPDGSDYDAGRPGRAAAACEAEGQLPQGLGSRTDPVDAVSGKLWWSASNWRNRITVPLTFAPVAGACHSVNAKNLPAFFGSEAALQATTQWSAKLCLTQGATSFDHVVAAEPLARTLVSTGAAKAGLTSQPFSGPTANPIVQAPVAATGFAISYIIDDADGNPFQSLRLTPRLLAKLLTESYPDTSAVKQNYPALSHNPLNVTLDPEFQALNPGIPQYTSIYGTSSLFSISTPSDVIYALTSYIGADPEARAWLSGKPDPWGMVVNPNYRGLSLPVNAWPLSDSWTMPDSAFSNSTPTGTGCEGQYGVQPQPPYLQLISSPVESMLKIAQSIEYAQPSDGNACNVNPNLPGTVPGSIFTAYTRAPRQFTGQRFVIGLTSLSDAAHYSLDTAQLETSSTLDPSAKFSDGSNRSFAGPGANGLKAAFTHMHRDTTTGTWQLDYDKLRSDAPTAYPGAMLIYADIPTKGLSGSDAKTYAALLRYMIGPGQVPGTAVGQLPDGYLPLTSGNGLGAQATYTTEAADDIAAQKGLLPGQEPPTAPSSSPAGTPTQPGGGSGTPTSGSGPGGPTATSSGAGSSPAPSSSGPASSPSQVAFSRAANNLRTPGSKSSAYLYLTILLILLLALGPLAAARARWFAGGSRARR